MRVRDTAATPFTGEQPRWMVDDLMVPDRLPHDGRLWVPIDEGVDSRPLLFDVSHGQYVHVVRVTRAGIVARHRHTGPVYGHVLRGRWHYLEHDWVAEIGSFVFEPPGETHTLVVPEGCDEMITVFHVTGALIYVEPDGTAIGYDDVFTRLEKTCAHFEHAGLPESHLTSLIR